jgi:hypothetical protein
MYLYLVSCVSKTQFRSERLGVYVVASSPDVAEKLALELMKSLNYKYDDFVDNIEVMASINTHRAPALLVVA